MMKHNEVWHHSDVMAMTHFSNLKEQWQGNGCIPKDADITAMLFDG